MSYDQTTGYTTCFQSAFALLPAYNQASFHFFVELRLYWEWMGRLCSIAASKVTQITVIPFFLFNSWYPALLAKQLSSSWSVYQLHVSISTF